ncbi:MAG: DUF1549 domain-containing protein, partial [Fimbriimonadaceae bacterium]
SSLQSIREDTIDRQIARYIDRDDIVTTVASTFLSTTAHCARCHDHKFDPITQKEFYQLFAYFNSINEYGLLLSTEIVPTPSLLLPNEEQAQKLKELSVKSYGTKAALKRVLATTEERFAKWEKGGERFTPYHSVFTLDEYNEGFEDTGDVRPKALARKLGSVAEVEGKKGKAVTFDGENGIAFKGLGARERWEAFTWAFWLSDPRSIGPVVLLHRTGGTDVGFCGFDLMLEDGFLTARVMRHWPGNALAIRSNERLAKDAWQHLTWSWDGSGDASGLRLYLNGKELAMTILVDKLWKSIAAYGDHASSGGDWCFGQRFRDSGFKGGKVDEIDFILDELTPQQVEDIYLGRRPDLDNRRVQFDTYDQERLQAQRFMRNAQEELASYENRIAEISVMEEAKPEIPAYVLARGDYD